MSLESFGDRSELIVAASLSEAKRAKEVTPISEATGVILCGGLGSRLRDVTGGKTIKPLLPLAYNQALIDNPLLHMRQAGVRDIYFVTAEHAIDSLQRYTRADRDSYSGIRFFVDDQPPTGTIPVLKIFIKETGIQTTMIKANGDEVYASVDIRALYDSHTRAEQPITGLLTDDKASAEKYKLWIDANRQVTRIQERPFSSTDTGGYYGTGLWVIDSSQFYLIQQSNSSADFLNMACERQKLYGHPMHTEFLNVNTPADLKKVQTRMQQVGS
jgi:NDP-sugar pyrophosphorylase family protein